MGRAYRETGNLPRPNRRFDKQQDLAIRALLRPILSLPYRRRVAAMGWLCGEVIGPALGWRRRIRANLSHVCPELDEAEIRRLCREVPDNIGRTLIEIYSGAEFQRHVAGTPLQGAGVEALRGARAAGRPVVMVTAHIGNFDALRATLVGQGYTIAGLYREMNNAEFNKHYVAALSEIGTPLFPTNRSGVTQLVRHLANGGIIGLLTDIYSSKGADVTFFGKPAPTATSACEWAVKYDALVIPCYGLRRADGLSFDLRLEAPVPNGDPVAMTQAINDNLEGCVRENMGQWFWIHRRWKPERTRQPRS